MKYSQLVGILAAIILSLSGFMNWTWYPDLQKYFTGFVSENNMYGKPGKVFLILAAIAIVFFIIPKIWAKRWNLFVCAFTLAFAIKSFILFSGCYRGVCPERQPGLWIMISAAALMMLAALLPDISVNRKQVIPETSKE
jgi:hypothetical protein